MSPPLKSSAPAQFLHWSLLLLSVFAAQNVRATAAACAVIVASRLISRLLVGCCLLFR